MTKRRPNPHQEGFTLIELMVSIVLLGMLTTALFTGVSFGIRAWKKTVDDNSGLTQVTLAQLALQNLLSSAYPLLIRVSGKDAHVDFDGAPDHVTFLSPATPDLAPGGLARITIQLEQDNSSYSLSYSAAPELAATNHTLSKTLLRGLSALTFSYSGSGTPGQPSQWMPEWRNNSRLPTLIRIQASFASASSPNWPDLTIRPRIAADSNCSFDPLTKYCRGY